MNKRRINPSGLLKFLAFVSLVVMLTLIAFLFVVDSFTHGLSKKIFIPTIIFGVFLVAFLGFIYVVEEKKLKKAEKAFENGVKQKIFVRNNNLVGNEKESIFYAQKTHDGRIRCENKDYVFYYKNIEDFLRDFKIED